jgi:hypothetical protein
VRTKLVTQNQQFDVLAELAAAAPHAEQLQQRREHEIREKGEHPPMLPELTTAEIENGNLVLEPLTVRSEPWSTPFQIRQPIGPAPRAAAWLAGRARQESSGELRSHRLLT